jgi:hypothetical protein
VLTGKSLRRVTFAIFSVFLVFRELCESRVDFEVQSRLQRVTSEIFPEQTNELVPSLKLVCNLQDARDEQVAYL